MLEVRVPVSVSDAELERIGKANPGWKVEFVDGEVVMSPTNSDAGRRNTELTTLLKLWAAAHGFVCFDSSTGFRTGPKSVLSPDGSLITAGRWAALTQAQQRSYAPIVPDVVVELISSPDDARAEHAKCAHWLALGARFVVALNPYGEPRVRDWGTAPPEFPNDWGTIVD